MTAARYFVRSRGRVTGPFEIATLEKLVRRGSVGRLDELSVDQREWERAGENGELFPQIATRKRTAEDAGTPGVDTAAAEEPEGPETSANGDAYFYRQNGTAIGPVGLLALQSLARAGAISKSDPVWQKGSQVMVPAGTLTHLAEFFDARSDRGIVHRAASSAQISPAESSSAALSYRRKTSRKVTVAGIVLPILTLLALHLPWSVAGGTLRGWWTPVFESHDSSDSQAAAILLIIGVLAVTVSAVAVLLVAPLVRGMGRGITCLCLGGVGLLFYFWMIISSPLASIALLMMASLFVIPIAANGLAAFLQAKAATLGGAKGNAAIGVLSGISAITSLIVLLSVLSVVVVIAKFIGVFIGITIFLISLLLILTSSVLGFVNLKPAFSPALNLATIICARSGVVLIGASLIVMVLDISWLESFMSHTGVNNSLDTTVNLRIVATISLLRVLVIMTFYPAIAVLGFEELAIRLIVPPTNPDRLN